MDQQEIIFDPDRAGKDLPENVRPRIPITGDPGQPNLDISNISATWSVRFWMVTVGTGIAAGIAGGLLMRLLALVEQTTWRYSTGTLLEAASKASAIRHVLALALAGVIVGVGGIVIRKTLGQSGDTEAAIWFRSGYIPMASTLTRAVHSIVAVGLGTSLGRESPIKQTGGAIASWLGRHFDLSRAERRLLGACGVGAGMAAAYNVPVGGALYAVEVLLGSISLRLAFPALLCSGVATVASWALLPTAPIYRVPEYPLSVSLTVWALVAGPILGLVTVPLVQAIGWANSHRPRRKIDAIVVPIFILTALGFISIAYPQLLGNGKDDVQLAYSDQFSFSLLLILPVLKLLSTAGCLGSGASGGLFTPTMTIGSMMGGLFGHVWDRIWPGASMGSCSVIGSCAFLAAATQGPISSLVLVLELTRHVDATMAPMLLAVAGAMLVARQIESRSIYSIRLPSRKKLAAIKALAKQSDFAFPISRDYTAISAAAAYAQTARTLLNRSNCSPLFVIDHEGKLLGIIQIETLVKSNLGAMPIDAAQAGDIADFIDPLNLAMTAAEVLNRFSNSVWEELPLVDPTTGMLLGTVRSDG